MAELLLYGDIKNGATFKVASATVTALAGKPSDLVGKVVTLTGNKEVGYGSSGDNPLGFVVQVEKETGNSDALVASVVWNEAREDIVCAGTETVGAYLACDGTGGLALSGTSSAPKASSAKAYSVDATAKTCIVYIHG